MKFLKAINKSEYLYRFLDLIIAILMILLFSPVFLIVAILIKITDIKAPVFADKHWRVGKDGRKFFMYKFRTMFPGAHEMLSGDPRLLDLKKKHDKNGGKLKIKDDIRITFVGRFIRRLDIDELPQFFNVLKGDMSIVGPRAYFEEEIELYSKRYPSFAKKINHVLKSKPGVTGLWQISGRNLLTIPQRIGCDYEYFRKKSIIFYVLILLKTPIVVLTRYGAYD